MGDSDRVPPTARAEFVTSRHGTVPTMPATDELVAQDLEATPISFRSSTVEEARETERRVVAASPSGGDERATLTVLTGIQAGQVHTLNGECLIGRGGDVDLSVDDQAVSRRHARLSSVDGGYLLEDLGSTNGSFVGGKRVAKSILRPGARIQLGPNLVLRYTLVDGTEEALQRRLFESSTRDALTGAFNRAYLTDRLLSETAYARRHKSELAVLMLDIDGFKSVNDLHGHPAGDAVLKSVADLVHQTVRVEDVVARYGGEEFVVLLRATGALGAVRLAERIRLAAKSRRVPVEGKIVSVTVSVGVAMLSEVSERGGESELVALADARLYRAKVGGRDRVCSTDE